MLCLSYGSRNNANTYETKGLMKRISTYLFLCVTASTLSAAAQFPKETEAFLELHCFAGPMGTLQASPNGPDLVDDLATSKPLHCPNCGNDLREAPVMVAPNPS